jgi:N-acyl homoserine lactone hydrolase
MRKDSNNKTFEIGHYQIDIIVHGFPGKSVCHGPLGFSTIALVRHRERVGLVDVGGFGQRLLLLDRLAELGLKPADVTDVLLTHSHYDHSINWVTFGNANVVIGRGEMQWALEQPVGQTYVPELYVQELQRSPRLRAVTDGDEVFPGIRAHATPGHTPGSLVYVLQTGERDVKDVTRASIESIWKFWSRHPGSILVPGHDLPMVQDNGKVRYLGEREAAIKAWYSEDLNKTTVISLTEAGR